MCNGSLSTGNRPKCVQLYPFYHPNPQMPQLIYGHNLPLIECIYRLNESIRTYVGIV